MISTPQFWLSIEEAGEHYIIPNFYMYKRDIWEKIYDFDENIVLEQLERSDYNEYTADLMGQMFVEVLAAYDITCNEKYYSIAKYISDKMYEMNSFSQYWIINKLQLLKRKRQLSDFEITELEDMAENPIDTMVSCAVEILLENKHNAKKKIELLPAEDKEKFMKFPIYNLL